MHHAYGGILFDAEGRVLLREPAGHWNGHTWTFPKGRPDPGESAEQTALREVREETGYRAAIVGRVPGTFLAGDTVSHYFLMRPLGEPEPFQPTETQAIRWATPAEAHDLLGLSENVAGRRRDRAVLRAALPAWVALMGGG